MSSGPEAVAAAAGRLFLLLPPAAAFLAFVSLPPAAAAPLSYYLGASTALADFSAVWAGCLGAA